MPMLRRNMHYLVQTCRTELARAPQWASSMPGKVSLLILALLSATPPAYPAVEVAKKGSCRHAGSTVGTRRS
jgi:hypothetical protein